MRVAIAIVTMILCAASMRATEFGDIGRHTDVSTLWVPPARTITINGVALDLAADRTWTVATPYHSVTFVVDGGGIVLGTGTKNPLKIPFGGSLVGWTLVGKPSGSVTVDVLRAANGAGLPVTSIIGGGTKPALSSAVENDSTSFTGWTSTTLNAKDNLAISLSGVTTSTYLALTLYYQ